MKLKRNLGEIVDVEGKMEIYNEPEEFWLLSFHDDGKQVGGLKIENGKLTFKGDADKSARLFFSSLNQEFQDLMKKLYEESK